MKREILKVEYLCGGHGFKADTTMFVLVVHYKTGDGTPQTFFGYTKDGEGYIFNSMVTCADYYINGDSNIERIGIWDEDIDSILEMSGEGFELFKKEGSEYLWFHN